MRKRKEKKGPSIILLGSYIRRVKDMVRIVSGMSMSQLSYFFGYEVSS